MSDMLDMELENQLEDDILQEDCEQELFTSEDVVKIIEDIMPKINLDIENLHNTKLDFQEFTRGVKETSYMCGQFVSLVNVGMSKEDAYNIVLNESTSRANLEISKIQGGVTAVNSMQNQI